MRQFHLLADDGSSRREGVVSEYALAVGVQSITEPPDLPRVAGELAAGTFTSVSGDASIQAGIVDGWYVELHFRDGHLESVEAWAYGEDRSVDGSRHYRGGEWIPA